MSGRRARRFRAALRAGAGIALAVAVAAPVRGAPAGQIAPPDVGPARHLYLPRLDVRSPFPTDGAFEAVPCPIVPDPCLPPGWRVVCGGIGRVRDLLVVRAPGGDGAAASFTAVIAVGDGAAVGTPNGGSIDWRVATGVDLGGLNHVTIGSEGTSWAVGDGARIARRSSGAGCWSIAATGWPTATLRSIELKPGGSPSFGDDPWPPGIGGWAVGRAVDDIAQPVREGAMIAQLDITRSPPLWRHLTRDADGPLTLPPLSDVQVVPTADGGQQIWAIGQAGADGVLARMRQVGGQWTWRIDPSVRLDGFPAELVMRSDRTGWAFGRAASGGAAAVWRLEGGLWRRAPTMLHAGQTLLDAYLMDFATVAYGLTPSAGDAPGARDAIRRIVGGGEWRTIARWPDALPIPADTGHRALAPLGADRFLYAFGDSVWAVDTGDGDAGWERLWRRLDVRAFAGDAAGGWALAAAPPPDDGVMLLAIDAGHARRWLPDRPLPPLRAIARQGTTYWAVGDGGATWWLPEGAPTWRPAPADGTARGDLLAVAATPGGALWAAGTDGAGAGGVWRMADGRWAAVPLPSTTAPLTSIAATDRGNAWAAGNGAAGQGALLFFRPAPAYPAPCPTEDPVHEPWARSGDLCVLATDFRGVDVDATGDDTLWLARDRDIVEKGIRAFRDHVDLGIRGPGGDCPSAADGPCLLPPSCRLTAIAAAHPAAVFAAAVCTPTSGDAGRATTRLMRWDGSTWRLAALLNTAVRRVAAGVQADGSPWAWAVGDWTTMVRFATD
ncbi:MAG: hypothetical protein ABI780_07260 [Ardenticatenales bacterium]